MPEKTEIFLVGYYGFQNTGDELILGSILSDLRKALPGASFTVISHDPDQTAADHGVRAIRWSDPQAIAKATERANLVIVGGGGLFHDTLGFVPNLLFTKQSWGLALYVGVALYGALARKRVMLWGVGVGPLGSELAKEYAKAACLAADVVTVRDELSKTLLESTGVPSSKITVTADSAFASRPSVRKAGSRKKPATRKHPDKGPTVGVVVRQWDVGVSPSHWEGQLAEALDGFARSERGAVVFIPFQALESEKENDVAVAKRIAAKLSSQADVTVLEENLAPGKIQEVIAGCDLLVGMRLHSVVIAAQAGVPVVALSYDPKVSALMERVGMPEFDLPLRKLQSAGLRSLMARALQRKSDIAASLRAAGAELATQADKNVELARSLLRRPLERKGLPPELIPIVAEAIKGQVAAAKQLDEQLNLKEEQVEELSAPLAKQHADNKELIEQVKHQREKIEELSASVSKQHADKEELIEQMKQQREKVEELSACVSKQHADKEELIEQVRQQREKIEELSAFVSKQHAAKEELIEQVRQQREKIEELSACVGKQHADNEQMIGQLKQRQEQIEELSASARKQHAEKEELISSVAEKEDEMAKLREQLQGKDRLVLQVERQLAVEKCELEDRLQELTQDHAQVLELSANLQQELATAQESRQHLALLINRRLSVRLRRSLHGLIDTSQARTPEPVRRALRGLYLPVYRILFPSGKGEFETLDGLGSGSVSLKKDGGRPT